MTTYRQTINRVLRNLGEAEIEAATTTLAIDGFPALVGQWVNIIKNELEDATNWRVLQDLDTATVLANTSSIALDNATQRSRVVRLSQAEHYGGARAMCLDITDTSNPEVVLEMDLIEVKMRLQLNPTSRATTSPSYFAVSQSASGLVLRVWPTPSTARDIMILMCTPEPRLDVGDLDTVISIPAYALEMGATWMALEERGEELGIEGVFTEQRYNAARDAEVARDEAEQGDLTEMTVV
jgi:hypothetical protein